MEAPIYHLEAVVKSKTEMEDFVGPLDLILHLLSKNKMEIQDIQISLILDQYLEWMDRRRELDLEVASEFVTMASQLVFIKTRMLLSIEDEEAKTEMDALIQSLEERRRNELYAIVKDSAAKLAPMGEFGRNIVTRPPEPMKRGKIFEYSQKPEDLLRAQDDWVALLVIAVAEVRLAGFEGRDGGDRRSEVGLEPFGASCAVDLYLGIAGCFEDGLHAVVAERLGRAVLRVHAHCELHMEQLEGDARRVRVALDPLVCRLLELAAVRGELVRMLRCFHRRVADLHEALVGLVWDGHHVYALVARRTGEFLAHRCSLISDLNSISLFSRQSKIRAGSGNMGSFRCEAAGSSSSNKSYMEVCGSLSSSATSLFGTPFVRPSICQMFQDTTVAMLRSSSIVGSSPWACRRCSPYERTRFSRASRTLSPWRS